MLDIAIAVSDRPVAPDQYRYVETHAWWLGTFGPHQHLTEHRLRQWVPARLEREWLLHRELTGAQTWLTGSAEQARDDGFDLRDVTPVGRFRAPWGEFRTDRGSELDDDLDPELDGYEPNGHELNGHDRNGHDVNGHGPDRPTTLSCAPAAAPRRGNWQSPTPEFFRRLPADADALLARLVEDNPGSWFGPFAAAVTSLRTALVPAGLRAAIFRALTGLPGVSLDESATNLDGHGCLAIVHDAGRTRTELMIDPSDGQFAGERDTLRTGSRCGLPAGTVISTTAVRTAVVNAAGELPRS